MTATLADRSRIPVTCPGCFLAATVPEDGVGGMATCPRCRTRFEVCAPASGSQSAERTATAARLGFADRFCPVCPGETLESVEAQELAEERCGSCHGSLLEGDAALDLVRDRLGVDPALLDELETFTRGEPIECPSCRQAMTLLRLKGNDVDRCSGCGALWLDGGELLRLTDGRCGAEAPAPPASPAGSAFEATFGSLPSLSIRQHAEATASTVLLGWDHANYYELRGPAGTVGVLAEKDAGLGSALLRNVLHSRRHLEAQLLDRHRTEVLMELDRPPWLFAYTMEVHSPALGRSLGRVRRLFHPYLRRYSLEDAMGRPFARISSPFWRFWTFPVLVGRQPVARIRKKWSGLLQEYYTRGDNFELEFGSHPWSLEQRALLVATAIAIDLDFFERRGAD